LSLSPSLPQPPLPAASGPMWPVVRTGPTPLGRVLRAAASEAGLGDVAAAVEAGDRLDASQGERLLAAPPEIVGALADHVRRVRHGDVAWFNRNQHINATNVCEASCIFCSFSRLEPGADAAYTMTLDQAVGRIRALRDTFVTEVHIVNGLNRELPFSYYTDLLRAIKEERPDIHIKGFTAVEIHYFAEKFSMTYAEVLERLVEAGLGSLPGGGAEIFHPRARRKLCADKVDGDGWLHVHRVAHRLGLRSNCTMLFGSIERPSERIDHLERLRALQDETGGFQTFIPLRFHNENNRLSALFEPTPVESLHMVAVARLMLDNIPHIKAYWPMLGIATAQSSLHWGADDLDGTVREERIYHMAGAETPDALGRQDLVDLIRAAGGVAVERDTLYAVAAEA
jgi:aminodeoxyfutalosine synthase